MALFCTKGINQEERCNHLVICLLPITFDNRQITYSNRDTVCDLNHTVTSSKWYLRAGKLFVAKEGLFLDNQIVLPECRPMDGISLIRRARLASCSPRYFSTVKCNSVCPSANFLHMLRARRFWCCGKMDACDSVNGNLAVSRDR